MANTGQHHGTIDAQFGPQANAYVTSAVHAQGADLDRLAAMLQGHGNARVLDLGCGGGHVSFTAAPHVAEVVAVDLSAGMLQAVAETAQQRGLGNIRTLLSSVEDAKLDPGSFDFVVSRYSAHHWRDLVPGLTVARRALKAGGKAVFIDVVAPADALADTHLQSVELLRDRSHVRDWSVAEWRTASERAGFTVTSVVPDRLPLAFQSWVERIRTPAEAQLAIRDLWNGAPEEVTRHFGVDRRTGDFTVDIAYIECTAR